VYHTKAAILATDFPATSADDVIAAYDEAVKYAEQIEDGSLRRNLGSKLYVNFGVNCYLVGRPDRGEQMIAKAKTIKVYSGPYQARFETAVDELARIARIEHGYEEGGINFEGPRYIAYRSRFGPNGKPIWELVQAHKKLEGDQGK
jgi:hypothetical protein